MLAFGQTAFWPKPHLANFSVLVFWPNFLVLLWCCCGVVVVCLFVCLFVCLLPVVAWVVACCCLGCCLLLPGLLPVLLPVVAWVVACCCLG